MGPTEFVTGNEKWLDEAEILTSNVFWDVEFRYAIHFSIWMKD